MLFEGKILDGRHRYKACQQLGISPEHSDFKGSQEEALAFALAKNAARRSLSVSQKALIAARLVQPRGRPKKDANWHLFSLEEAALKVGVSERSVNRGLAVLRDCPPAVISQVEAGEAAISAAAVISRRSKAEQTQIAKLAKAEGLPLKAAEAKLFPPLPEEPASLPVEELAKSLGADLEKLDALLAVRSSSPAVANEARSQAKEVVVKAAVWQALRDLAVLSEGQAEEEVVAKSALSAFRELLGALAEATQDLEEAEGEV